MSKVFGISKFVMDSGERSCLVIDRVTELPEYYPNLFLTVQYRNSSHSFSSIEKVASALIVLLRFCQEKRISLEERILTRVFLRPYEIDALRDYAQKKTKKSVSLVAEVHALGSAGKPKSDQVGSIKDGGLYDRLTTFAKYFEWYAETLITRPNREDGYKIEKVKTRIESRRPKRRGRGGNIPDKALDQIQLDLLFEVFRIGSDLNPFHESVQVRNRLMFLALYHFGIRGGELLGMRVPDVDMHRQTVSIMRRPDEADDTRINEPNTKTLDRSFPVTEVLAKEFHDYISKHRSKIRNASKNDFIFVVHKSGPTMGQPISKSTYYKIMDLVKAVAPQLHEMTGHRLRHSWNDRFSEQMDTMDDPPDPEKQEQIRSHIMGWKEGSGTAASYNRRFIKKKATEAALALQSNMGMRIPKGIENVNE